MTYLRMDLKVCEGCGALWLRAGVDAGVYCKGCACRLAEFPAPRGRRVARTARRSEGTTGAPMIAGYRSGSGSGGVAARAAGCGARLHVVAGGAQ
jgi:hypothetical protein